MFELFYSLEPFNFDFLPKLDLITITMIPVSNGAVLGERSGSELLREDPRAEATKSAFTELYVNYTKRILWIFSYTSWHIIHLIM